MAHSVHTPGVAAGGAYAFARDGYDHVEHHHLTTEDIENATVYGREDETIGSVQSLQVGSDGKITHAVVDVGGFLGIGAHSVLLPFSNLVVLRASNGMDTRVHLDTTKEQLKAMPHHTG